MRLSKLEIKGFKSFGEKAIVQFNEGVTAIVGPNGCGKSNVIDAIRWVLGEQSTKALRSEKMENIIFNGTKTKKAAQLAEVSLTFENTKNILPIAYSEVCITRRLFRNGDSEYRLNNVQCRLKDITDLFLDTGIGSDSYAIIELKMIDEIITNKEHSRRALFEEAAGIAKYKLRKKQALSKLTDTEIDISRVEDLLFEIKKNLKVLENQAKKAEKYKVLKEQYQELNVKLAILKIGNFKEILDRLNVQEQSISDDILKINTTIEINEAELEALKLDSIKLEKNLSVQQKATNEFINQIKNYENENKLKNQQLHFIEDKIKRLESEYEKDNQQLNHVKYNYNRILNEYENELEKFKNIDSDLLLAKENIDAKHNEVSILKSDLIKINNAVSAVNASIKDAEKDVTVLNIQIDSFIRERERNDNDSGSKQLQLTEFSEKLKELAINKDELNKQLEILTSDEAQLQSNLTKKKEEVSGAQKKLIDLLRIRDAKENEYKLTKSLVDNLEGYPQSIKYLRKQNDIAKKAPLLSDILFCKEEYRIAIENFLEPVMNFLVLENHQEAIESMNQLANASVGKAGFFILSTFTNLNYETATISLGIPALQVLEVEAKYIYLCKHLLKDVYLVDHQSVDIKAFTDENSSIIFLNKSGKFIQTKYSIFGGSVGLFEGKRIGRVKNLELLAKEIKNLEVECEQLALQINNYESEIKNLETNTNKVEIEKLQKEIYQTESLFLSIEIKEQQYKSFLESANFQRNSISEQINKLTIKLSEKQPILLELKEKQSALTQQLSNQQNEYNILSESMTLLSNAYNQQNIAFHQQQNKVNNLRKELDYRESQEKRLLQQLETHQKSLNDATEEKQVLLKNPVLQDAQILEMYEQRKEMESGLQILEQAYYTTKGDIADKEKQQKTLRENKEQIQLRINDVNDKKVQLKIDLNSLKERLLFEFNIQIDDLLESQLEINESEMHLNQEIYKLKKLIEEFGPINSMAVEAYQEINNRFTFIQEQKHDLLNAKKSLLQTIDEIDTTAKEKFMTSFIEVRNNFINVFRSLFNDEDSCDLLLSDEANPLDSEINIIAKPKGKRPLTINQLSGGEKTLTSIALLFSLYLLKPAPFCIFDEVDAPLDDTNIDKFNQIIRKFSVNSQFIIVSHNKKTISYTDIIYGVTMPEQGISKLVAVDLRDFESV